jgi:hypothetical protein
MNTTESMSENERLGEASGALDVLADMIRERPRYLTSEARRRQLAWFAVELHATATEIAVLLGEEQTT